jgi:hypothetical protein
VRAEERVVGVERVLEIGETEHGLSRSLPAPGTLLVRFNAGCECACHGSQRLASSGWP